MSQRLCCDSIIINQTTTIGDILDEDDLVSDSNTALATQQSIKAYVDNNTIQSTSALGTDNAIIRADGTGRNAQASDITIDDSGQLVFSGAISISRGAGGASISIGAPIMIDSAENSIAIGNASTATGDRSISLGYTATCANAADFAISIGDNSDATAVGAIALGNLANATTANAFFLPGSTRGTALPSISATALHYDSASGQVGPDSSSRYTKTDIGPLESNTENIFHLEPHSYSRVSGGRREPGYIAEEAVKLFPELTAPDHNGNPYSFNYSHLVIPIVEELKKLRTEFEQCREEFAQYRVDHP